MNPFTIIGFYQSTGQRFADTVHTRTAEEAEDYAEQCNPGLVVCGVVAGEIQMADKSRTTIDE